MSPWCTASCVASSAERCELALKLCARAGEWRRVLSPMGGRGVQERGEENRCPKTKEWEAPFSFLFINSVFGITGSQ